MRVHIEDIDLLLVTLSDHSEVLHNYEVLVATRSCGACGAGVCE